MFFVHRHAAAAKVAGNQQATGEAGPLPVALFNCRNCAAHDSHYLNELFHYWHFWGDRTGLLSAQGLYRENLP